MSAPASRYQHALMDSARWESVDFRDGDIVVSTPAKCGTTWTQIICGLLVFARPELPKPLDEISLWPEAYFRTSDEVKFLLDAQEHRRIIKSHTPLDGIPWDEGVTYICIGRDPRDVAVSVDHHIANTDWDRLAEVRAAAGAPELGPLMPPPAPTLYERVWNWIGSDDMIFSLKGLFAHIESFWERRGEPNVLLLHYDDLKSDLEGQMRAIAAALGIEIDEADWPGLVNAATFDEVRGRAETLAPENTIWKDRTEFFHKGSSGQWRDVLGSGDLERYRARVAELTTPEIADWIHGGPL